MQIKMKTQNGRKFTFESEAWVEAFEVMEMRWNNEMNLDKTLIFSRRGDFNWVLRVLPQPRELKSFNWSLRIVFKLKFKFPIKFIPNVVSCFETSHSFSQLQSERSLGSFQLKLMIWNLNEALSKHRIPINRQRLSWCTAGTGNLIKHSSGTNRIPELLSASQLNHRERRKSKPIKDK